MTAYDVIGDVHGHAGVLRGLLAKLGYVERGAYRHPERQAVFVGDLIDRGPEQLATLRIVRSMVDAGDTLAVLGNHEFNAVAWATRGTRTADGAGSTPRRTSASTRTSSARSETGRRPTATGSTGS